MSPAGKLVFAQLFVPVRTGTQSRFSCACMYRCVCVRAMQRAQRGEDTDERPMTLALVLRPKFFLVVVCIIVLGFISNQRWAGRLGQTGRRIVYRYSVVSLMPLTPRPAANVPRCSTIESMRIHRSAKDEGTGVMIQIPWSTWKRINCLTYEIFKAKRSYFLWKI